MRNNPVFFICQWFGVLLLALVMSACGGGSGGSSSGGRDTVQAGNSVDLPPQIIPPDDLVVVATGDLTPVNLGVATVIDDVDDNLPVTPDPTSPFSLGVTQVTWSTTDSAGNTVSAVQTVTVQLPLPDSVDPYKIIVANIGNGGFEVSGLPGSTVTGYLLTITNINTGYQITGLSQPDGSFSVELSAQSGDLLSVIVSDGSGNNSLPTEVYAEAFSIKNPYTADGHWYVGQTHMHTKDSDGVDYPHEMEIAYYDAGYDFVVSTDHRGTSPYFTESWRGLTPDPNSGNKNLLWIRGSELGFGEVHMGAWGQTVRTPIGTTGIQDQINTVRSNGGVLAINHPEKFTPPYAWDWSTETIATYGYSMVEAYNGEHSPEKEGEHRVAAIDLADDYRQVWWIGTDDCHNKDDPAQFDKYAIVVQTAAPIANQLDILSSVDSGNMYIRQSIVGPEINTVDISGNTVTVTLADIGQNYKVTWRKRGDEIVKQDTGINVASSYIIQGDEGYVRAEIENMGSGLMAYTQPLFIGNNQDLSVSASVSSGSGGQNLVDNDGLTDWDAGASTGSFVIDMNSVRQINALKIDWVGDDGRRFNYRIEASATGEFSGEEIKIVRESYDNRSAMTLDFFDVYARYIKVIITSQSVGTGDSVIIREVEVYDSSPGSTELYIDNVNGDDSNSGLAGSPWRTFLISREKVRPRDTLRFINTGVPFEGLMEARARHSGKHPGAVVRYQGDLSSLTQIDSTGDVYGVRFIGTRYMEFSHFDIFGATQGNILVYGGTADTSTIIRNNRLHDGLARGLRASGGLTLAYNLIYGNAESGAFIYTDGVAVDIFNNVFFGNVRGLLIDRYDIDATVRNNIFSANTSTALYETSIGVVTDSHNCVDGSYVGDWQKLSNVEADPLLADPANGDFSLQSGSPCIDAGIDLNMSADFNGNDAYDVPIIPNTGSPGLFTRDFIDIGALEFGN